MTTHFVTVRLAFIPQQTIATETQISFQEMSSQFLRQSNNHSFVLKLTCNIYHKPLIPLFQKSIHFLFTGDRKSSSVSDYFNTCH
jgi:hypothetical protein